MNKNTISSKIKLIGTLFAILMISIVATTIYLNEKNKKDSSIINTAGKQRMLSQKISKNIFYLYHNDVSNIELEEATNEFIYNLNILKNENITLEISKKQNLEIKKQILRIEILWNDFYININIFYNISHSLSICYLLFSTY